MNCLVIKYIGLHFLIFNSKNVGTKIIIFYKFMVFDWSEFKIILSNPAKLSRGSHNKSLSRKPQQSRG